MTWQSLKGCLGVAGLVGLMTAQSALAEGGASVPIRKISVDSAKQVIVEFAGNAGAFPPVPHVLDLPGPNHRVVLDFADATVDKASLPTVEELSTSIAQSLPFVKAVRYSNLTNTNKPTARVVIDLPENLTVKPRVVKLEEGQITINLGAEGATTEVASTSNTSSGFDTAPAASSEAAPAPQASEAAPTPVANAQPTDSASTSQPASDTTSAPPSQSATAGQAWDWSSGNQPSQTGATPVSSQGTDGDKSSSTDGLKPELPLGNAPLAAESASAPTLRDALGSVTDSTSTTGSESTSSAQPDTKESEPTTETATPAASDSEEPKTTGSSNIDAVKRYNAAVQNHLSGKLVEAVSEYQAALKLNPNLSEAHSNLGLIFNQQHNYAQALSEFRKALAINPRDAITYNGIGAALRAQKDLLGAIKNWQTAVSLDSHLATAHYNLGTAYEIQKDYDKAVESYKQAVKNDYRLGEAYYRLGLIMERKHRTEEAAEQFSQALKVSSNSEYSEDARQRLAFLTQTKKTSRR